MNQTIEYKVGEDIISIIEGHIYDFYNGKVDFKGTSPERTVYIRTGIGGMHSINKRLMETAKNSSMVISAMDVSKISNGIITIHDSDENGEPYTQWVVPFLANVRFYIEPSFDNSPTQEQIEKGSNPKIQGFLQSSYNYTITDNLSGDVIELIANGYKEPEVPKKYYWLHWLRNSKYIGEDVIIEHPFSYIAIMNKEDGSDFFDLTNWKEITKEEYELWNKVNDL